ncbi:MAG TPA: hypothetical protein VJ689_08100, partial [Gaiellaceae bacterium]|nr:hypothetical protein [Gaiellaceae bacterium]
MSTHDGGPEREHKHGPGCDHDHGHGHGEAHDHAQHRPEHEHEHGPGCDHDHEHGHGDDHDHAHHHDHDQPARAIEATQRPCVKAGTACQYDLAQTLPGERDEVGRFQKLELLLETEQGITDAHFRDDGGRPEVCIHYEPEKITLNKVIALVKTQGLIVSDRYKEQTWLVRGMDSAQCGFVIEHALRRMPG